MPVISVVGMLTAALAVMLPSSASVPSQHAQLLLSGERFSIRWGKWQEQSRPVRLRMRALPMSAWLTDQRLANDDRQRADLLVLRVAPGDRESGFAAATWRHDAEKGEVVLDWSTPFQGVTARFEVSAVSLQESRIRGVARTWSHSPGDRAQEASIELTRRRCL